MVVVLPPTRPILMPPFPPAPPARPAALDGDFPPALLARAVAMAQTGMWALNLATRETQFSDAQRELLGFCGDGTVRLDDILNRISDDDVEEVSASLQSCAEEGTPFEAEFRFAHPERGEIWIGARAGRIDHPDTGDPYVVGVNFDVTRRRTAEIDAREVSREMAHRMKNVFALIGGLARMISRTVNDVPSFVDALGQRTVALARLSDMTLHTARRGIELGELVHQILEPYDGQRVAKRVGHVQVNAAAAQTLILALNELATNALKYGGLAGHEGKVDIRVVTQPDDDLFRLEWSEWVPGGISEPAAHGFGTQVLTRLTRNTYGGVPKVEWRREGLRYTCTWSLARMVA